MQPCARRRLPPHRHLPLLRTHLQWQLVTEWDRAVEHLPQQHAERVHVAAHVVLLVGDHLRHVDGHVEVDVTRGRIVRGDVRRVARTSGAMKR